MNGIEIQNWLSSEIASALAASVEGMTGERPPARYDEKSSGEPPAADDPVCWRQPFTGMPGAVWVVAEQPAWGVVGAEVLRAAEIEDSGAERKKSEYLEIVRQMLSAVGQALTGRLGREVTPAGGELLNVIGQAEWGAIELSFASASARIAVGIEPEIVTALTPREAQEVAAVAAKGPTFDLLLDVELPVSISFGRAQVPLRDVLKLTVGSIVELNRAIADPVDVIVNNCVIARGEVVVVEGNFGVRIQNVISRQERLRTLD